MFKSVLAVALSATIGSQLLSQRMGKVSAASPVTSSLPEPIPSHVPAPDATKASEELRAPPVAASSRPTPPAGSSPTSSSGLPGYVKNHSGTRDSFELFQALYGLGIPNDREMHLFSGFLSATDTRLRIPSLVAWTIRGSKSSSEDGHEKKNKKERKSDRSRSQFLTSPFIPEEFNAQNSDYSKNGYDRGHLCPCGDFYYALDQKALNETFYLSHNIVPQDANNNRFYWLRLEMFTRGLAKQFDNVHVLAGPLFVPEETANKKYIRYEVIGENNVAVPNYLYRVLIGENKKDNKFFIQAFMIPNKPIPQNKPLTDFIVPVSDIEKHSGMKLLHKIDKNNTAPLCKNFSCVLKDWQELEMQKVLWDKESTKETIEKEWKKLVGEGWTPSPKIQQQFHAKLSELSK